MQTTYCVCVCITLTSCFQSLIFSNKHSMPLESCCSGHLPQSPPLYKNGYAIAQNQVRLTSPWASSLRRGLIGAHTYFQCTYSKSCGGRGARVRHDGRRAACAATIPKRRRRQIVYRSATDDDDDDAARATATERRRRATVKHKVSGRVQRVHAVSVVELGQSPSSCSRLCSSSSSSPKIRARDIRVSPVRLRTLFERARGFWTLSLCPLPPQPPIQITRRRIRVTRVISFRPSNRSA